MKKIGIITFHRACNYGAFLQAYALQETLNDMEGVEASLIDYRSSRIEERNSPLFVFHRKGNPIKKTIRFFLECPDIMKRNRVFRDAGARLFRITEKDLTKKSVAAGTAGFSSLITGSDQVWNRDIIGEDNTYFLEFAGEKQLKYSYAASIGKAELTESEIPELIRETASFRAVSVREADILPVLREKMPGRYIVSSLDPVFLYGADKWRSFAVHRKRRPYVLFFMMGESRSALPAMRFASEYARKKGISLIYLSDRDFWYRYRDLIHAGHVSPEVFVGLIDQADCVVTNSFHATAFSIILHKPFFVETEILRSNRIVNLLETAGLLQRGLKNGACSGDLPEIRWDEVDRKMMPRIRESHDYLEKIASETAGS